MESESHMSIPLQDVKPGNHIESDTITAMPPSKRPSFEAETLEQATQINDELEKTRSSFRTFTILIALYLTLFIAALDQTIVATAAPTISASLHSAKGYTWIGGAYLLANAASGPIWTKVSDIWGRKPILLIATAWFFFASIICARANSMKMLLAGRALQGAAGGGLLQMSTVVISDLFSMRRRTLWLGLLEVVWAIAGGSGPVIGGVTATTIGWQWNFWINLPVCGLTFIMLFVFLDVHNPKTNLIDGLKAIDWFGSLAILATTLMLLLGLDFGGETFPWSSAKVICLLVFGSVAIVVFIFSETKFARYPVMPLHIFKERTNVATTIVTLCQGIVFIGGEFYMPFFLQSTKGASPLKSGLLIIPLELMMASFGIFCGAIIHQYGCYRELIWAGTVIMTLGNGLFMDLNATSSLAKIIVYQLVAGMGCGLLFHPPIIAIQAFTAQHDVATATSTLMFVRNIATSLGVVVGGVVFQNSMSTRQSLIASTGLPPDVLAKFTGSDAMANVLAISEIQDPAKRLVIQQVFAWSIRNMWLFYMCVGFISIVAAAFVQKKKLSEEHTETKTGLLAMEKRDG